MTMHRFVQFVFATIFLYLGDFASAQCVNCGGFALCVPTVGNGYLRCRIGGEGDGTYCIVTGLCSGARAALNPAACSPVCKSGDAAASPRLLADDGHLLQVAQQSSLAAMAAFVLSKDQSATAANMEQGAIVVPALTSGEVMTLISQGLKPTTAASSRVTFEGHATPSTFVLKVRDASTSTSKAFELVYAKDPGEPAYALRTWREAD